MHTSGFFSVILGDLAGCHEEILLEFQSHHFILLATVTEAADDLAVQFASLQVFRVDHHHSICISFWGFVSFTQLFDVRSKVNIVADLLDLKPIDFEADFEDGYFCTGIYFFYSFFYVKRRNNPKDWKNWIRLTDRFNSGDVVDEIAFAEVHGHFGVG